MKLRTSILSLGLATLLGAPAVADDPLRITDLAPESTFLVIGADDMDATCRHFEQTPLAGLWRTEAVQDLVGESFTDGIDMMMESLRDEGIESEPGLPRSMGVAIYGDLDEETGMSRAFIVGFAEFKDMGDDGDRMMEMLVKEGVDGGMVRLDRREVRGDARVAARAARTPAHVPAHAAADAKASQSVPWPEGTTCTDAAAAAE